MGRTNLIGSKSCRFRIGFQIFSNTYINDDGSYLHLSLKSGIPVTVINNEKYFKLDNMNLVFADGNVFPRTRNIFFDVEIYDGALIGFQVINPIRFNNVSLIDNNDSYYFIYGIVPFIVRAYFYDYNSFNLTNNNELFRYIGKDCNLRISPSIVLNLVGGKLFFDTIYLDSFYLPSLYIGGQSLFTIHLDNVFDFQSFDFNIVFDAICAVSNLSIDNISILPSSNSGFSDEIQCLNNIDNSLKQLTNEVINVGNAVSSFNVDIDVINNDKEKSLVNTVFPYKNFKS